MFEDETYICQVCGQEKNAEQDPPEWRPDLTQRESAGNVCPECLADLLVPTVSNEDIQNIANETDQPTPKRITDPEQAYKVLLAGNCYFTLKSAATGSRFTFRVATPKSAKIKGERFWYVNLLNGSDNTHNYTYMANLKEISDGELRFWQTAKCMVGPDAPSSKAFTFLLRCLQAKQLPPGLEIWHEGRCGRCGRLLTVPRSINLGIGPECENYV